MHKIMNRFDDLIKSKLTSEEATFSESEWTALESKLYPPSAANFSRSLAASATIATILVVGISQLPDLGSNQPATTYRNEIITPSSGQSTEPRPAQPSDTVKLVTLSATSETDVPENDDPAKTSAQATEKHKSEDSEGIKGFIDRILPSSTRIFRDDDITVTADGSLCTASTIQFELEGASMADDVTWLIDGVIVKTGKEISHQFTETGEHELRITLSQRGKTDVVLNRFFTINENPAAQFVSDQNTNYDCFQQTLHLKSTADAETYRWKVNGDVTNNNAEFSASLLPGYHQIELTTTNQHGCSASSVREVRVSEGFQVFSPGSFTPSNADGQNDVWLPSGSEVATELIITIVRVGDNRVVFESTTGKGWDGRIGNTQERARQGEQFMAQIRATDQCGYTQRYVVPILVL